MLFITLCNKGRIFRDPRRLTIYRIHESSSQADISSNFEKFISDKRRILELHLNTYEYFRNIFNDCESDLLRTAIDFFITDVNINLALLCKNDSNRGLSLSEVIKYNKLLINSFLSLMIRGKVSRTKIVKFYLWFQIKVIIVILARTFKLNKIKELWIKRNFNINKSFGQS